jgi:hypothetical protein
MGDRVVVIAQLRQEAHPLTDAPADKTKSNNGVVATCGCDPARKIRLSTTTYEQGSIYCGIW